MSRFLAHVLPDGTLRPVDRERLHQYVGRDVWVSLHKDPSPGTRSSDSNRHYWGVVVRGICEETGNDPESVHYGLKREAVRLGILEPEYLLIGDQLVPAEPTTVTDSETFSRYVSWVIDWAREKLGLHLDEC